MRIEEALDDDAILARLDAPDVYFEAYVEPGAATPAPFVPPPLPAAAPPAKKGGFSRFFVWVAVLTSALAVLVETVAHTWAGMTRLDPIPTGWHVVGLALVPLVLALTAWRLRRDDFPAGRGWWLANGFVAGTCLWHAFLFIPFIPVALIGVILMGLGLLPLSPYLALGAATAQAFTLRRRGRSGADGRRRSWPVWLAGIVAALALFGGGTAWNWRVDRAIEQAVSTEPARRAVGLAFLRRFGGERRVLAYCHGAVPKMFAFGSGPAIPGEGARALYFRLTGADYRTQPAPGHVQWRNRRFGEWDEHLGDTRVGQATRGVSLRAASLDGSVAAAPDGADAGPCVAYLEMC